MCWKIWRKEDFDLLDYQNPLVMVRRMVLETGGSPLALRRTKNCGDKSRGADDQCRCHMKENCELWKSNYHREEMWGENREKKQTREQLLLQARSTEGIMCMSVFVCLRGGVVQPQALHSTIGTTAKSEWGKAAALGRKKETLWRCTERERDRGVWQSSDGWRWRNNQC